jgi:hypothetical protein
MKMEPPADTVYIGDQVTLKVRVKVPDDRIVFFPQFGDDKDKGIEILETSEVDTVERRRKEFSLLEKRYRMTSFEPGEFSIREFFVITLSASGIDTVYADSGVSLWVKPAELAQDFQPYDIRGIRTYPSRLWLWICLLAVGGALLAALAVYLAKKYKARKAREAVPFKKINPYEWAAGELAKLKAENISTARTKEYYSRLTDIVREYIELQTDISVMEKTSDEMLAILPTTAFNSPRLVENVRNLFFIADLVKFAKYSALLSECETSWLHAVTFVEESNQIINELKQSENDKDTNASGHSPV